MLLAYFNGKEHLRHRAVSLRQHGFLVLIEINNMHHTRHILPISRTCIWCRCGRCGRCSVSQHQHLHYKTVRASVSLRNSQHCKKCVPESCSSSRCSSYIFTSHSACHSEKIYHYKNVIIVIVFVVHRIVKQATTTITTIRLIIHHNSTIIKCFQFVYIDTTTNNNKNLYTLVNIFISFSSSSSL